MQPARRHPSTCCGSRCLASMWTLHAKRVQLWHSATTRVLRI
ncbi:MAG: hypothetical protein EXS02_01665 [Planctomycetes bacterium]|nr:hypothetical protein [Planctomycetota bacterium]